MRLADQIRAMGPGDHVCLIYETLHEQVAVLGPFIRDGIGRGERCLYICDDRTAGEITGALRGAGVDVEAGIARGALRILTKRDAYLASGEFCPESMLRVLRALEAEALAEGYTGLRVTGEMTWALGGEAGCERLMEYESLINRYLPGSRTLAICQYNRARFPAGTVEQVLQTHPVAIVGDRVISNLYFEAPDVFGSGAEARVSWKLRQLQRAHAADALVGAQKRSLELVVAGAPLEEVLRHLAATVEEHAEGSVASIMLLDGEGRLRNAAAPGLPEPYLRAIDGLPAAAGVGTCCAAAATGQVVVTPDFASDPGWEGLSHLPLALGLVGAWSMPILGRDGGVLGTFGTYFRERRAPTAAEREVVAVLARTAAVAIERRRSEDALRRAKEEAEGASRAKSQFLAVMSHELRTPLTGIIGYADLLGSDIWGPTTEEQRTQVGRIKSISWHLVAIIDEILTFSRMEAGREAVSLESADLAALVRECAELLGPQAGAKDLELRVLGADRALPVVSDPGKLRQIVLNLAGNAVKFTDRGSVEIAVRSGAEGVCVRVSDTGPGIPPEKLEGIFEPFVQGDGSSTRTKGGTGLGLTVCRSLARLLGGDVVVAENRPGRGTTFELRLAAAALLPPDPVPLPA